MCVYSYIHNKYTPYTHICKQKLLFWMRLIAINHLTALIYMGIYTVYIYIIIHFSIKKINGVFAYFPAVALYVTC